MVPISLKRSVAVAATRGGTLELGVGGPHLAVSLVAEGVHTISPVQGLSDLLIRRYEALEFSVKLNILTGKHVAMVLQSVDFGSQVTVLALHGLGGETDIVLLTSRAGQVIVGSTALSLNVVKSGRQVAVAGKFSL